MYCFNLGEGQVRTDRMCVLHITRPFGCMNVPDLHAVFDGDSANMFDVKFDRQRVWLSVEFLYLTRMILPENLPATR